MANYSEYQVIGSVGPFGPDSNPFYILKRLDGSRIIKDTPGGEGCEGCFMTFFEELKVRGLIHTMSGADNEEITNDRQRNQ